MSIITHPSKRFAEPKHARCFATHGSSLFIGLQYGNIMDWNEPGKSLRIFAHDGEITCLLVCGDTLWSASLRSTINLWNIKTGECTKTIHEFVFCLVQWKHVVFGGGIRLLCSWYLDESSKGETPGK